LKSVRKTENNYGYRKNKKLKTIKQQNWWGNIRKCRIHWTHIYCEKY